MKVTLMMCFNQSILQYKNLWTKVQAGLLIRSLIIRKYNSLVGSSYIKLPNELEHPKKDLINTQNLRDNE